MSPYGQDPESAVAHEEVLRLGYRRCLLMGRGALSRVFKVTSADGNPIALKLARGGQAAPLSLAAAALRREGQILGEVGGGGVVRHLGSGVVSSGAPYLALEWVRGVTLAQYLERRPLLPLEEVVQIVTGVASVLDGLMTRGVLHRDLKPANIMLVGADPQAIKLIDFGLARAVDSPLVTGIDDVPVGTLAYMAPEQFSSPLSVTPSLDRWSLGVIAYRLLTGALPFDESSAPHALTARCLGQCTPASALRPQLGTSVDAFFQRALAPDPRARFSTASATAAALARSLRAAGVTRGRGAALLPELAGALRTLARGGTLLHPLTAPA